jgi:ribosomal protein S18 acetylase RimI-like enzyme
MTSIEVLTSADVAKFRELRLRGLEESPTAFGSSYAQEVSLTTEEFEKRLMSGPEQWLLGAKIDSELIGVVGFGRETADKSRHRGYIWGMYVEAKHRGRGIGRSLLGNALLKIDRISGLRSVKLGVTASNVGAINLYEAFGFVRFGLEPEYLFVDGVYHSMLLMSRPVPLANQSAYSTD